MLPKHHFKLVSHRQTTFACSDEIFNFFECTALKGLVQFVSAEFWIKLHAEAKRRGMTGSTTPELREKNEQLLITMMSELTFSSNTPVPAVKPIAKPKSKPANV